MPDEIKFEKFNLVFKLKILESSSDLSRHQNRLNFDKFRKVSKCIYIENEILRSNMKSISKNSILFEN